MVAGLHGESSPVDRLVARNREMETLAGWWREVWARAEPRLGVVVGEAGVGKSRLVAEFARGVESDGGLVLRGASHGNAFLAYEPWVAALRELARRPGVLEIVNGRGVAGIPWLSDFGLPVTAQAAGTPTEETVADVVAGLLGSVAAVWPTLVVLDDIQWADRASVDLLRRVLAASTTGYLVLAIERQPVAEAGAWHEARAGSVLSPDWELPVGRFDDAACAELLVDLDHRFDDPQLAAAVAAASHGNAFAVRELAAFVGGELQRLRARDIHDAPDVITALPQTATALWIARLEPFDRAARSTLAAAAVIGLEFEIQVLERVQSELRADVMPTVDAALAAGIVEEVDDGRYRFSHGLIRDHLYDGLSEVRRRRLHRAVARALEQDEISDAQCAALAVHYLEAGSAFRREALAYTIAAARWNFSQGGFDTASTLAERGLELLRALEHDGAPHSAVELGDVLGLLGHRESQAVLLAAVEHYEAADDLDMLAYCADLLLRPGAAAAIESIEHIVAFVERILPRIDDVAPALKARVLARFVFALDYRSEPERQRRLSSQALAAARASGDPDTLALALFCDRPGFESAAAADRYLAAAQELTSLGREQGNLEYLCNGLLGEYVWLVDGGDVGAADRTLSEAAALAERIAPGQIGVIRSGDVKRNLDSAIAVRRVIQAELAGRLDDAEQRWAEVAAWAAEPDLQHGRLAQIVAIQFGQLCSDRGNVDELAAALDARLAEQDDPGLLRVFAAWAYTEANRLEDAARYYQPLAEAGFTTIAPDHSYVGSLVVLARVAFVLGDTAGAGYAETRLAPFAGRNSCNGVNSAGPIDHARGLCALTDGRYEEAVARFAAARDLCRRMGSPSFEARAELHWAEALARAGTAAAEAGVHASRAQTLAGELGMKRIEQLATELLARLEQDC